MKTTNLPENWCVCSLDDVLSYEQPQPYIVKNANYSDDYKIPVPSLAEQERIVAEIETRFERADAMELAVQNALDTAEKLKQAILKKAFRGELVPQNPNDEPASVLLECIRSQRLNEQKKTKKGIQK